MHKTFKTYRRFFFLVGCRSGFVFNMSKGSTTNKLYSTLTKLFQIGLFDEFCFYFLKYKERKCITEVIT